VHFRYPDGDATVLDDVSIDVAPGTSLALCGASGSGKTTLVDILLGLIQPDEGTILYGTVPVGRELVAWRERIGYVPQDVYIQDSSVLENVAFGEDPETVDISRVRDCLTRTQLLDFIEELPEGLNTRVGERGVRFSGGQRQRLGVARALYRWPEILILDEATSALDNETEHEITETLKRLHGDVTTIIVAHRLSTVRHVDSLVFLESGRVVSTGTFNEVRKQNAAFNHLVELGSLA
jgi:ABC-type multidrug transport system fused ATPase/permease subunit